MSYEFSRFNQYIFWDCKTEVLARHFQGNCMGSTQVSASPSPILSYWLCWKKRECLPFHFPGKKQIGAFRSIWTGKCGHSWGSGRTVFSRRGGKNRMHINIFSHFDHSCFWVIAHTMDTREQSHSYLACLEFRNSWEYEAKEWWLGRRYGRLGQLSTI